MQAEAKSERALKTREFGASEFKNAVLGEDGSNGRKMSTTPRGFRRV